jgi:photosystem II stability/assembly factor-like uncharacterized protein
MRAIALLALYAVALSIACSGGSQATPSPSPSLTAAASPTPEVTVTPTAISSATTVTDMVFIDTQHGWQSGGIALLATKDGGATWQIQETSPSPFRALDFVSPLVGWAVAAERLLGTTDGGATWQMLGEPDRFLVDMDFVSPSVGWGVSSCVWPTPVCPSATARPDRFFTDGRLVKSVDGGHTWSNVPTPSRVESVCGDGANNVWAAGGKEVLHSGDGGETWSTSLTAPFNGDAWAAKIQCVASEVAWVEFLGGYAALSHAPWAVYRTLDGGQTWEVMAAEPYTLGDIIPGASAPGSYPGPFSLVDDKTAFITGVCPVCGHGSVSIRSTTDGGATWSADYLVAAPDRYLRPVAVDFVDAKHGWVALASTEDSEILATSDGGRTWTPRSSHP